MSERCKAKTSEGTPCRALAVKDGLCDLHANPGRAAELGRKSGMARRAEAVAPAKDIKAPQTAQEVREMLGEAIADVRARRLDTKTASSLGYLAGVLIKSIEVSELVQRLAAIEIILKTRVGKN
jgi:hypothetical protein